jgi:hypothetical protein
MSQTGDLSRLVGMASQHLRRGLAALLALTMGGNGVVMLAAGRWWYAAVPGVVSTGPYNPHFVQDIGMAYVVVGLAFAAWAARPSAMMRGAAGAAALFLVLHACIHLAMAVTDPMGLADFFRDFPGVFLPALIAGWVVASASSRLEPSHAQSHP